MIFLRAQIVLSRTLLEIVLFLIHVVLKLRTLMSRLCNIHFQYTGFQVKNSNWETFTKVYLRVYLGLHIQGSGSTHGSDFLSCHFINYIECIKMLTCEECFS